MQEKVLTENLFFEHGADVSLGRQVRYLPACWHKHTFFEILFVLRGTCKNYLTNHTMELTEGDVCILAPGTLHALSIFSDDCLVINLLLRSSTFEKVFLRILPEKDVLFKFFAATLYNQKKHSCLLFHTYRDSKVSNFLVYAYAEFYSDNIYKEQMVNSIVTSFFISLLNGHGRNVSVFDETGYISNENLIEILRYLQNGDHHLSLKQLAQQFGYSERHMSRLLKELTGMSFGENVQKLRMERAAVLLEQEKMIVASVAEKIGYSNESNFRQAFKKYYGMTPYEYKNKSNVI